MRAIERRFWERLQALDWNDARKLLAPYLSSFEFRALQARHEKVVERLRQRIAEAGEGAVLFSFGEAGGTELPEIPAYPSDTPEPQSDGPGAGG